jgi:hypothetical protein
LDGSFTQQNWLRSEFTLGKMPPSQKAAAKKPRMTLAQVSAYDDILTDALVDHVSGLRLSIAHEAMRL